MKDFFLKFLVVCPLLITADFGYGVKPIYSERQNVTFEQQQQWLSEAQEAALRHQSLIDQIGRRFPAYALYSPEHAKAAGAPDEAVQLLEQRDKAFSLYNGFHARLGEIAWGRELCHNLRHKSHIYDVTFSLNDSPRVIDGLRKRTGGKTQSGIGAMFSVKAQDASVYTFCSALSVRDEKTIHFLLHFSEQGRLLEIFEAPESSRELEGDIPVAGVRVEQFWTPLKFALANSITVPVGPTRER